MTEEIIRLYLEGHSGPAIGRVLGCHSSRVYDTLRRADISARLPHDFEHPRGEKHPMWGRKHTDAAKKAVSDANRRPGSKNLTTDGYLIVHVPEHPYADSNGDVREHRLVMEKRLGRYLLPQETVHHINGVRSDNRDENLSLFDTRGAHSRHHAAKKVKP